jgi:hypothetical protein
MYIGLYGGSILIHEVRLVSSVADPDPVLFFPGPGSGSGIRDGKIIRIQIRDPG